MPSLAEVRQKYPQYNDMSDQEFADKFHAKFYSDLPKEEFYKKLSFSPTRQKEPESLLNKAGKYAEVFNKSVEEIPQNLLEIGAGAGQGLANVGSGINRLLTKGANLIPGVNLPEGPTVNIAPNKLSSKIGEFGGSIAGGGALLKGLNAIRGIPTNIGTDIAKNAFAGSAMSPEDQGLGALLGGGGAALGNIFGKAIPKITDEVKEFFKPGSKALEGINPEEVRGAVEAGRKLGTNLTPAEASGNQWTGSIEGSYKRGSKGSFENLKLGREREVKEKQAINKLLTNIYDGSVASNKKINKLYKDSYRWNLKPELVNNLKQNTLIDEAMNKVRSSNIWKDELKGVPENNLKFFDLVKRQLGSLEDSFKSNITGKATAESRQYSKARTELSKVLDKVSPEYKEARKLSELQMARSGLEKTLKKDLNNISGSELYRKVIDNDFKFKKLLKSVRNSPEAVEQLHNMKKAWKDLINLRSVKQEEASKAHGWGDIRNTLLNAYQLTKDFFGLSDSKKAIQYIKSDKWFKDLEKAHQSKDKNRLESTLSGIIGKILPGSFNAVKEGKEE